MVDSDYDIQRIIMNINIETHLEVTPEDTLIIFDEIQEAPRALEALKYFCETAPEYHREYLEAMGEEALARLIPEKDYGRMGDFRDKYIFWLKNYYYVGGMPEVVGLFREHKDYRQVRALQTSILEQYEADFGKHASAGELARIRMVWNSIPMQLAKENKKFFFGQIKQGARMKDFELAIEWLLDCRLIKKVYRVNKLAVPLKAYIDFSAFKLFIVDIGLLGALSELDAESILEGSDIFTEFKGAMSEQ